MNRLKQRIAIAEAVGWKWRSHEGGAGTWNFGWFDPAKVLRVIARSHEEKEAAASRLPDYLTDLNAMHKAEKLMQPNTQTRFQTIIFDVCENPISATATQRAEAFLKTLGLWKT